MTHIKLTYYSFYNRILKAKTSTLWSVNTGWYTTQTTDMNDEICKYID